MDFNKEQREGMAKVSDNVATACMAASTIGGFVEQKIGWKEIVVLVSLAVVLLFTSIALRKGDENGN